jgi:N-6 DNA Methylase
MPDIGTLNLPGDLQSYGVSSRSFRDLRVPASLELLGYLDLLSRDDDNQPETENLMPDGVAESQGRPLLFVVNESRLAQTPGEQEQQIQTLRRKLACRGDRAYLARIRPGELAVVPVSLRDRMPDWKRYTPGTPEALTFFSRLAQGQYDGKGEPKEADYVFSAMFKLVWSVADRLAAMRLKRADVLSLMGRALFFRFLKDRHVILESNSRNIARKEASLQDCFANAENAANTSAWLEKTFNGDLLPLIDDFNVIGHRTGGRVFFHLSAIIRGDEPSGDQNYQIPLGIPNFGQYDFAHVPVGLLSQVYERFAWKWEHLNAQETSVHYTPRNIAATLVDEAFAKLPNAEEARVLDPACGAGVFLVLAFRRLYQERWKATGQRPNTKVIREILDRQLAGFEISESAIKLAALSLYLTAIELDPKPVPPEKLRFHQLRDRVLFNFRREGMDPKEGAVAGSLGGHVGRRFDGKFDLVVSNPPWTSLKRKERSLAKELNRLSKSVIARRADQTTADAYENPDFGPDLPFVWKATEWCQPGGRIAMTLPARILLKQEDVPRRARETLLRLVEVTGIINCANLRKTKVWPNVDQPFLLLFARNREPERNHSLRFITPYPDVGLNVLGETRIDAKAVQPIEIQAAFEEPSLWKTLTVGTSLDSGIIARIRASNGVPLNEYWVDGYATCQGYKIAPEKDSAEALKMLPDLHSPKSEALARPFPHFMVDVTLLQKFSRNKLHRTRLRKQGDKVRVYRAPLVLVKVSPPTHRNKGRALLSLDDVAYNESYYGYSAPASAEGELAARCLHLLVHSSLWLYYALMTSGEIGVERPKLQKGDLDRFPIIPADGLSSETKNQIGSLSRRLLNEDDTVFDDIDALFAKLYGLDWRDLEVIADTLEIREPSDEMGKRASVPPSASERNKFKSRLETILRPFFKVTGDEPQVELWKPDAAFLRASAPFGLLLISNRGTKMPAPDGLFREVLLKLAEDTGSTRIIQQVDGGLVVALLNQYRYWTLSRARLLGAELVREHLDVFET